MLQVTESDFSIALEFSLFMSWVVDICMCTARLSRAARAVASARVLASAEVH